MYIWILLLTFYVLIMNLRGYKKLFTKKEDFQGMKDKVLSQGDSLSQSMLFTVIIFAVILVATPSVIFYLMAADVFLENKILFTYAVIQLCFSIYSAVKIVNFLIGDMDKVLSIGLIKKVLHPINTVYICYFGYYIMLEMQ